MLAMMVYLFVLDMWASKGSLNPKDRASRSNSTSPLPPLPPLCTPATPVKVARISYDHVMIFHRENERRRASKYNDHLFSICNVDHLDATRVVQDFYPVTNTFNINGVFLEKNSNFALLCVSFCV